MVPSEELLTSVPIGKFPEGLSTCLPKSAIYGYRMQTILF